MSEAADSSQRERAPSERDPPRRDAGLLMHGEEAWWHFLEARDRGELLEPGSVDEDEPLLELEEVGRIAQRNQFDARPSFQVSYTQSLRCDKCSAQIPADLTFCVYCGAAPRFMAAMRGHVLVVEEIEEPDILEELGGIIEQGNAHLQARELRHALAQPPAVFYFQGRDEHADAFVTRLHELGIRARTMPSSRPDVPMVREVAESILRNRWALSVWAVVLLLWSGSTLFLSPVIALGGFFITMLIVIYIQSEQYTVRYRIDVVGVLNALTGFDSDMVRQASQTLLKLQDEQVKELLTRSLMEYYAIWRRLAAARVEVRPMLGDVKESLDELMIQILGSCVRYAELHQYSAQQDMDRLDASIEELEAKRRRGGGDATTSAQLRELQAHREVLLQTSAVLAPFRERLERMWRSLESLRRRVSALTLQEGVAGISSREEEIQTILATLDTELDACEEVLDVVSPQHVGR